jgi:hypothetical protein
MEHFAPTPSVANHGEFAAVSEFGGRGSAFRSLVRHAQVHPEFTNVSTSHPGPLRSVVRVVLVALLLIIGILPAQGAGFPAPGGSLSDPVQHSAEGVSSWRAGDYRIEPLASYDITARVLGVKWYPEGTDRFADVSTVDLALGWGMMADRDLLEKLNVSQKDRWYFVRWKGLPITAEEVINSSANTHIIPASPEIAAKLENVKLGDVVHLKGYLVDTVGGDGWSWASSIERDDTGGGSCESFWVEEVEIEQDEVLTYAAVR